MITGFNTDIDFNGVTYHVQTEDKGVETPLILSLVYNRGTILASKRSYYNDLLENFDEKVLAERLHRQHKLICAAIKAGRIEDLKRMTAKTTAAKKEEKVKEVKPKVEVAGSVGENKESFPMSSQLDAIVDEMPAPQLLTEELPAFPNFEEPKIISTESLPDLHVDSKFAETWIAPIEITDADLIFDEAEDLDDVIMLPDEAIEILTDFSQIEAAKDDPLFVELLNEVTFKSGETKTVSLLVGKSKERNGLAGANIMVKVLGSSFRPLIFHSKTDSNGVAIVNLQLPQFSRGRAAILFRAMNNGEEVELRRLIHPG